MKQLGSEERELTVKEMMVKTGRDLQFFKRARKQGLPFYKYGKAVRFLWSDWLKWQAQHRKVG